jgi:hypothetical protein
MCTQLARLLWLEELQHEVDIRQYDMTAVTLHVETAGDRAQGAAAAAAAGTTSGGGGGGVAGGPAAWETRSTGYLLLKV